MCALCACGDCATIGVGALVQWLHVDDIVVIAVLVSLGFGLGQSGC